MKNDLKTDRESFGFHHPRNHIVDIDALIARQGSHLTRNLDWLESRLTVTYDADHI